MSSVLFDVPGPNARRRHRIAGIITVLALVALVAIIVWRFWTRDQFTAERWEPFVTPRILEVLLDGLLNTIKAAVFAIAGAVVFGLVFGTGKLSNHRLVRWVAWTVVEFFRAVPLLMLITFIFIVYNPDPFNSFWCLVIGLTLYNGSVLAEIFRAGINAVPKGQGEAAYALGLRKSQVMNIILLPQAVKIMLPAIISQCIVALKDTSLGYAILAPGLTVAGKEIWGTFNNKLATALVLMVIYVSLNLVLTWLATLAQKRVTGDQKIAIGAGQVMPTNPGGAL